jgi:type VI protein secretion system component VasK
MDNAAGKAFLIVIILAIVFLLYFLPALIAFIRDSKSATQVTLLNLFLGWTFLGWVISLVWAFGETEKPQPKKVSSQKRVEIKQSLTDKLEELSALKDKGLLTDEEFIAKKSEVLASV